MSLVVIGAFVLLTLMTAGMGLIALVAIVQTRE